jgi:hypothetical protein
MAFSLRLFALRFGPKWSPYCGQVSSWSNDILVKRQTALYSRLFVVSQTRTYSKMALDFCRSGLFAEIQGEQVSVPLTGVSVRANIIDLVAEVSIEQRYVNKENNPIEAVYKFPLDEGKFH